MCVPMGNSGARQQLMALPTKTEGETFSVPGSTLSKDVMSARAGIGTINSPTLPTLAQLIGSNTPPNAALPINNTAALDSAGAAAQLSRQGRRGFAANLLSTPATRRTGTISRTTLTGM